MGKNRNFNQVEETTEVEATVETPVVETVVDTVVDTVPVETPVVEKTPEPIPEKKVEAPAPAAPTKESKLDKYKVAEKKTKGTATL